MVGRLVPVFGFKPPTSQSSIGSAEPIRPQNAHFSTWKIVYRNSILCFSCVFKGKKERVMTISSFLLNYLFLGATDAIA